MKSTFIDEKIETMRKTASALIEACGNDSSGSTNVAVSTQIDSVISQLMYLRGYVDTPRGSGLYGDSRNVRNGDAMRKKARKIMGYTIP